MAVVSIKEKDRTKETVVIAMATDDNYFPYFRVALQSLLEHISQDETYELIVLYSGNEADSVKENLKDCYRSNLCIDLIDMLKNRHGAFYTSNHISLASYDRLYLPSLFPQYNKILYLDSDLIILDDVALLFHAEMEDNYLAGVRDECFVHAETDLLRMARREHLLCGATSNENYVNAGVLLMNLSRIREDRVDKLWFKLAKDRDLVFHDQSVLNVICDGRIGLVDETWNFQVHNRLGDKGLPTEIIRSAKRRLHCGNYKIVHFSTPEKPWLRKCSPLSYLWWIYAKKTSLWLQLCKRFTYPYRVVKWRVPFLLILSLLPIRRLQKFCLSKIRKSYIKPISDYAEWLEMQDDPRK